MSPRLMTPSCRLEKIPVCSSNLQSACDMKAYWNSPVDTSLPGGGVTGGGDGTGGAALGLCISGGTTTALIEAAGWAASGGGGGDAKSGGGVSMTGSVVFVITGASAGVLVAAVRFDAS